MKTWTLLAAIIGMSACTVSGVELAPLTIEECDATIRISNTNAAIDNCTVSIRDSASLTIRGDMDTSGRLKAGTRIRLLSLDFGYLQDNMMSDGKKNTHARRISLSMGGTTYTSEAVSRNSVDKLNGSSGGSVDRLEYPFASTRCVLVVGVPYDIVFLDANGNKMDEVRYKVAANAATIITNVSHSVNGSTYCPLVQLVGELEPPHVPSVSIDFQNEYGLDTAGEIGLAGHTVPGGCWNRLVATNNAEISKLVSVNEEGDETTRKSMSVSIEGTRGHYYCYLLPASTNPLHGYIDDDSTHRTPTVNISGVPYDKYRVVVYHSTDQADMSFGYDLVNGMAFTGAGGHTSFGTLRWGDSGAYGTANPIEEGVNAIVTPILANNDGKTLSVTAHAIYGQAGAKFARSGIAAIQIIDATHEVEDLSRTTNRVSSTYSQGAWTFPGDMVVADRSGYGGMIIGTNAVRQSLGTTTASKLSAHVLALLPEAAHGTLMEFDIGENNHVRAVYRGDGTFLLTYNDISADGDIAVATEKVDVSGVHVYSLTYSYDTGLSLYQDQVRIKGTEKIRWRNQQICGQVYFGSRYNNDDALSGLIIYAIDTDFLYADASRASRVFLQRFTEDEMPEGDDGESVAWMSERFTHLVGYGDTEGLLALMPHRTSTLARGVWSCPLDANLADGVYVEGLETTCGGVSQSLPGVATNAAVVSVLACLPGNKEGVVANLSLVNGTSVHYVFAYANTDGTVSLGWETEPSRVKSAVLDRWESPHVWTLAFDTTAGARLYRDGSLLVADQNLKFSGYKVGKCVTFGNTPDERFGLSGMKIYAVHTDFGASADAFDTVAASAAHVFDSFDFMDGLVDLPVDESTAKFAMYREVGLVGSATLNGEEASAEQTKELISLFGSAALDGVTFTLDGIDFGDGTLKMSVSPAVKNGTLSVLGKRELADRWRRVRVTYGDAADGSDVMIDDGDAADCRFFKIRAELGEKQLGYMVSTSADTGSASCLTSAEVNGDVRLFSLSLSADDESDFSADDYTDLTLNLTGVKPGATLRLKVDGVSYDATADGTGKACFSGISGMRLESSLTVDVVGDVAMENIDASVLSGRAGVESIAWGIGLDEAVEGGVTNTMTMLARSPESEHGGTSAGRYRIPAMAKSTNGVIAAAYDCRYRSHDDLGKGGETECIDTAGNFSFDNGATWTRSQLFIDVINATNSSTGKPDYPVGKDTNIGDPCILYDPCGDRFLLMGITGGGLIGSHDSEGHPVSDCVLYRTKSGKDKYEWVLGSRRSMKQEVLDSLANMDVNAVNDEHAINGILQGPGHGFSQRNGSDEMPSGALVFPMQYFSAGKYQDPGGWFTNSWAFAIYSKDGGETWTSTKLVPARGSQESCAMELDDGSWVMMAKCVNESKRFFFRSTNYCDWVEYPSLSPSAQCQGSCLRIGEGADGKGRYVACFATRAADRGNIKLHVGKDSSEDKNSLGITWTPSKDVVVYPEGTGGLYAYNSLVMIDRNNLGVLLEVNGRIYFRKIDVSHILDSSD